MDRLPSSEWWTVYEPQPAIPQLPPCPPHEKQPVQLSLPEQLVDPSSNFSEIFAACVRGDLEFIQNQRANFHNGNGAVLTLGLNHAIAGGHLHVARHLLQQGAKWDYETLEKANVQTLELLMEFGFEANDTIVGGSTLLLHAVSKNDIPKIEFLLSRGANPNLGPPRHPQALRAIEERPVENSGAALGACVASSTPEVFKLLLRHGAKLENAIPLHVAVSSRSMSREKRFRMMEFLVEEIGVDVNGNDDAISAGTLPDGTKVGCWGTPLNYAKMWGMWAEADWLVRHGAV